MDILTLVIKIIKLVEKYGIFDTCVFEFLEVDQKPDFYLGVITLRPKKE